MAAGIGEASAIVQLLQIGFSLAITLTTYIADAKDAPNEISSLATELDATLRHVEELDNLLKENEVTKVWTEDGVILAQKCRTDCEIVVKKLVNLLGKSGTGIPERGTIERGDIDISLFKRFGWIRLKPQVKVIRHELQSTKIQILVWHTMYNIKASNSKEDQALGKDRMSALLKSQQRIDDHLRDAKEEEQNARHEEDARVHFSPHLPRRNNPYTLIPEDNPRNKTSSRARKTAKHRSRNRGLQQSDSESEKSLEDYEERAFALREDFRRKSRQATEDDRKEKELVELRQRIKRLVEDEEARKRAAEEEIAKNKLEEEKRKLEADTKEQHRRLIAEEVTKYREDFDERIRQMREAFDPPLPVEQIHQYLEQQPNQSIGEELAKIFQAVSDHNPNKTLAKNAVTFDSASTQSGTSIKRRGFSSLFARKSKTPKDVEDTFEYDGPPEPVDCLKTIKWDNSVLIMVTFDGSSWTVTRCSATTSVMQESLLEFIKTESRRSMILAETLQTYSRMPNDCKKAVTKYLETGDRKGTDWDLVLVRCHRASAPIGLRLIRRVSGVQQYAVPGQAYMMLYLPAKKTPRSGSRASSKTQNAANFDRFDNVSNDTWGHAPMADPVFKPPEHYNGNPFAPEYHQPPPPTAMPMHDPYMNAQAPPWQESTKEPYSHSYNMERYGPRNDYFSSPYPTDGERRSSTRPEAGQPDTWSVTARQGSDDMHNRSRSRPSRYQESWIDDDLSAKGNKGASRYRSGSPRVYIDGDGNKIYEHEVSTRPAPSAPRLNDTVHSGPRMRDSSSDSDSIFSKDYSSRRRSKLNAVLYDDYPMGRGVSYDDETHGRGISYDDYPTVRSYSYDDYSTGRSYRDHPTGRSTSYRREPRRSTRHIRERSPRPYNSTSIRKSERTKRSPDRLHWHSSPDPELSGDEDGSLIGGVRLDELRDHMLAKYTGLLEFEGYDAATTDDVSGPRVTELSDDAAARKDMDSAIAAAASAPGAAINGSYHETEDVKIND